MRSGRPQGWLRHDLLRSGQRRVFVAIRLVDEIRRQTAFDGAGRHRSRIPRSRSPHVEATSRKSLRLLLGFGIVGRGRCRVADAS